VNIERYELLSNFCDRIGYQFRDFDLLNTSLTHSSVDTEHNERLEFLGDAVLGLVIGETLYDQFPAAKEGDLSRLRSNLVKGETLSVVAREFELYHYLQVGGSDLKTSIQHHHSLLEDAVEAVIGAIYLDSDFECARKVVLRWFENRLESISLDENSRDPKSRLQEYVQANSLGLPQYRIVRRQGSEHNQTFFVQCRILSLNIEAEGTGRNRKSAEQEAAKEILQMIGEQP